jgi:glutaconyl-CoA/methylmalonyl-CoA decarboxylase subunit gamma
MKNFKFKIQGEKYEVKVKNFENRIAELEVNGTTYEVEVDRGMDKPKKPILAPTTTTAPKKAAAPKKAPGGAVSTIESPLPGDILSIEVKVGDLIAKGDKLMVMEAMKMENNVMAEKAGEIKAIKVAVGDSVLQGDVLIEIA